MSNEMQYRVGLKRSLKSHFSEIFDRLQDLLTIIPSTLPHTQLSKWQRQEGIKESGAHLKGGTQNKVLRIAVGYSSSNGTQYTLKSELRKGRAFGLYERTFVNCLTQEIASVVDTMAKKQTSRLLVSAPEVANAAVADFLKKTTRIDGPDFLGIIRYFEGLAQQSYEARPITYGVLISPRRETKKNKAQFPANVFAQKRFQAVTDGYKTALLLDCTGKIISLLRLKQIGEVGEHFRPIWLDPLADEAYQRKALGIALTRTGAILIMWKGNLILSHRLGKWVLWHHSENIELISEGLKRAGPKPKELGRLAAKLYRCALDVSFRKTGGLFITLRSRRHIGKLVKLPEQLKGTRRTSGDRALGEWLGSKNVIHIEREILADLAALDGAIVIDRSGRFLSYGAVLLLPRKAGLGKIEGSRSRAAHSASFYGLSIKISSDGGIKVIESGDEKLSI